MIYVSIEEIVETPNGEEKKEIVTGAFEAVPRVGEEIHSQDDRFKVIKVIYNGIFVGAVTAFTQGSIIVQIRRL